AAHDVSWGEVVDVAADLEDLADELMPDDERRVDRVLRPWIPVGDVQVGTADARLVNADPTVVDRHPRLRDVPKLEAGSGLRLHERLHGASVPRWSGAGRYGPRSWCAQAPSPSPTSRRSGSPRSRCPPPHSGP